MGGFKPIEEYEYVFNDDGTWYKKKKAQPNDPVNHPSHYTDGNIEVIDYIFDNGFGRDYCLGNAIKYISRAGKKDSSKEKEDLMKARWYLDRYIQELEETDKATRHETSVHEDVSYFSKLLNMGLGERLVVWDLKDGTICVAYAKCDIKDESFSWGVYGRGVTFEEACKNYYEQISHNVNRLEKTHD